jgi:hypothetical protein
MECTICYNEINSSTGKVELSCSHPFHFSCLTTWFDKQNYQGMHANCPICRHEANEFEKMPEPIEDEEEEDDDTSDSSDDEPLVEAQYTIEELAAQERARILFERLKFINPIEEVQAYAANKIKACWRGYQDRALFKVRKLNIEKIASVNNRIEQYKETLAKLIERDKFFKATSGLTRIQRKNFAATKIQSRWRAHRAEVYIATQKFIISSIVARRRIGSRQCEGDIELVGSIGSCVKSDTSSERSVSTQPSFHYLHSQEI